MQIPQTLVSNYTKSLNGLSSVAQGKLAETLRSFEFTDDVASDRDRLIKIMKAAVRPYVQTAATASSSVYDVVRKIEVGKPLGHLVKPETAWNEAKTEEAVRAFVQHAVDGKPEMTLSKMVERVDYEIKLAAANAMKQMGRNDPRAVRWGRVPDSDESCEFCLMLASQGFVYKSEETADMHIHSGCNCRVMPSFGGADYEGYDPSALRENFKASVQARVDQWNENHPDDQRTYSQVYEKTYGTLARTNRAGNRQHR